MTDDDLREKCAALAAAGCAMSAAVLPLIAERDGLRDRVRDYEVLLRHHRLIGELAERVLAQGELLSRRAERPAAERPTA